MKTLPDVCLVLEGTYPYVSGGVSAWVHALIQGLPDLRFTLWYLGADRRDDLEMKYQLPPNVVGLQEFFILDQSAEALAVGGRARKAPREVEEAFGKLHHSLKTGRLGQELWFLVERLAPDGSRSPSVERLLRSPESWGLLTELYERYGSDTSFIDYYWTFVFTHLPVFRLFFVQPPPARVYHTISTGYAGFVAALASARTGRPMLVTEHGIYTHERELEIAQASWIYAQEHDPLAVSRTRSFFKQWWINMFRFFSRVTYEKARWIITITGVNQPYQRHDGADPAKMRVIPNGIAVERFAPLRRTEGEATGRPFTVGFVGRVVPIKDIKTLLRALKVCHQEVPDMRAHIVGPYDEDPEYYEECLRLRSDLDLETVVEFTGRADVTEYYPKIDVLVLTSTSEAVPLVILDSSGLRAIIGLQREGRQQGFPVSFGGFTGAPARVLKVTHMDLVMDLHETAEEAEEALRRSLAEQGRRR